MISWFKIMRSKELFWWQALSCVLFLSLIYDNLKLAFVRARCRRLRAIVYVCVQRAADEADVLRRARVSFLLSFSFFAKQKINISPEQRQQCAGGCIYFAREQKKRPAASLSSWTIEAIRMLIVSVISSLPTFLHLSAPAGAARRRERASERRNCIYLLAFVNFLCFSRRWAFAGQKILY